jgi:hypothetical protein
MTGEASSNSDFHKRIDVSMFPMFNEDNGYLLFRLLIFDSFS